MDRRAIMLNREDYRKLSGLVDNLKFTKKMQQPHFKRLAEELKSAVIAPDDQMPANVVTIGSKVRCSFPGTESRSELILVFPADVRDEQLHLSILSPLGLALMGEHEGTEITYIAPGGEYAVRIEQVTPKAELAVR